MKKLFSSLKVGEVELPNRIVIPPMCQYSAKDGMATAWHTAHYNSMALSGAGLLIIEATAVLPEGRISIADLGLWNDETEQALKTMISNIRENSNMPIAIQLAHAGRKASTCISWEGDGKNADDESWQTYAPSALAYSDSYPQPKAITESQIETVIDAFVKAAKRAERAGVNGVEIHAAHGYLLHEFLSPLSNHRDDQYGGSFENRIRLVLDVVRRVKSAIKPETFLLVRISATDWAEGGWDLEQSTELSIRLQEAGCQVMDISSGGLTPDQKIDIKPNYQVPFAAAIKQRVNIPVIAVGLITEPIQAETILQKNEADLIAVGRGMLFSSHWPWHAAIALGEKVVVPPQYFTAKPRNVDNFFKNNK